MCIKLTKKFFTIDSVNSSKLHYQSILKKYLKHLNYRELAEHSVYQCQAEAKSFLKYLFNCNVQRLSKLTNEKIFNYIFSLDKYSYSMNTKSSKVSKIRLFLKFAYVNSYTKSDFSLAVPKSKVNHNAIINHTIWTEEQVNKILNSIDRSSTNGKRDYAILILISHLGLRFCDVKELKFGDINWQMNTISISQSKTRKYVSLPLTEVIGNAIIDYIKNERPNVNYKYIFLSDNEIPFNKKDTIHSSFKKYLELAGIDISNKKYIGVYTLRHSLASLLLQKRTPLSTISSILGHTDINNTAIYLKVDVPSLRECCLDLEVF